MKYFVKETKKNGDVIVKEVERIVISSYTNNPRYNVRIIHLLKNEMIVEIFQI